MSGHRPYSPNVLREMCAEKALAQGILYQLIHLMNEVLS